MARIATLVGMNRMPANKVMLLHAGDFFVGEVFPLCRRKNKVIFLPSQVIR
jgi:hypothetical protein